MNKTNISRPGLGSQFCRWLALCLAILGIARGDVRVTECESVFTFGTGKQNGVTLRPGLADPNFDGASRNFISGKGGVRGAW